MAFTQGQPLETEDTLKVHAKTGAPQKPRDGSLPKGPLPKGWAMATTAAEGGGQPLLQSRPHGPRQTCGYSRARIGAARLRLIPSHGCLTGAGGISV